MLVRACAPIIELSPAFGAPLFPIRHSTLSMSTSNSPPPGSRNSGAPEGGDVQLLDLFREPGGEFEVDIESVKCLTGAYRAAEQRWATAGGGPRRCGVLEDPDSMLSKWWYDPINGPRAKAQRYEAAKLVQRRITLPLRMALVAAAVGSAFAAPSRVAWLSLHVGAALHLALPAARLVKAAVDARCGGDGDAPAGLAHADATHVLTAQHLLGAASALPLASLLWRCGAAVHALLFGAAARLCLLPGLWYWRDLNEALLRGQTDEPAMCSAVRAWRLVASFLLVAEASLFARLALALDSATAAALAACGEAASPGTLMRQLAPPLGSAAKMWLLDDGGPLAWFSSWSLPAMSVPSLALPLRFLPPLHLAGAIAPAGAARVWLRLRTAGLLTVVASYAAYWIAFPAEMGTRRTWGPRTRPRQRVVRTPSTALLSLLSVTRPIPKLSQLRRWEASMDSQLGSDGLAGGEAAARAQTFSAGSVEALAQAKQLQQEDVRLRLWSMGLEDLQDVDGTMNGGNEGGGSGVADGTESWRLVAAAGGGGRSGVESRLSVPPLGQLLLNEDKPGATSSQAVPADMRWGREEAEARMRERFLAESAKGPTGQPNPALAEYMQILAGLLNWDNDAPPGYEMPEIVLDEELEAEIKKMRAAARKSATNKREPTEAEAEEQGQTVEVTAATSRAGSDALFSDQMMSELSSSFAADSSDKATEVEDKQATLGAAQFAGEAARQMLSDAVEEADGSLGLESADFEGPVDV